MACLRGVKEAVRLESSRGRGVAEVKDRGRCRDHQEGIKKQVRMLFLCIKRKIKSVLILSLAE